MNYIEDMPNELKASSIDLSVEVRAEMERQKISLNSLASKTGIPISTLRRRVIGFSPFTTDELFVVTTLLGVKMSEIISRAETQAAA